MKNNTLKALGIAIGAAMSVMLASDMEVHAAEVLFFIKSPFH